MITSSVGDGCVSPSEQRAGLYTYSIKSAYCQYQFQNKFRRQTKSTKIVAGKLKWAVESEDRCSISNDWRNGTHLFYEKYDY